MRGEPNPGTLQFLVGRHLDRMGAASCNPRDDNVSLDSELMWLSALCYPLTQGNTGPGKAFRAAWNALDQQQKPDDVKRHTWDAERRFKQISLYIKLLFDSHILQRASTPWDVAPEEEEAEAFA